MAFDIVRWAGENRKLIASLLVLVGASYIAGGLLGIVFDYAFGSGIFGEESDNQVQSIATSFTFTAVFNFSIGAIFITLGYRLFRTKK